MRGVRGSRFEGGRSFEARGGVRGLGDASRTLTTAAETGPLWCGVACIASLVSS